MIGLKSIVLIRAYRNGDFIILSFILYSLTSMKKNFNISILVTCVIACCIYLIMAAFKSRPQHVLIMVLTITNCVTFNILATLSAAQISYL